MKKFLVLVLAFMVSAACFAQATIPNPEIIIVAKGSTYTTFASNLNSSYNAGPTTPTTQITDVYAVFKAAWQYYYSPARGSKTALECLKELDNLKMADGTYAYKLKSIGLLTQEVATAIEGETNINLVKEYEAALAKAAGNKAAQISAQAYLDSLNTCLKTFDATTCCPTTAAKYTSALAAGDDLIAKINEAAGKVDLKCGTNKITSGIDAWIGAWTVAIGKKDAVAREEAIETSLADLVKSKAGFETLNEQISDIELKVSRAKTSGTETQAQIKAMVKEKADLIASKEKADKYDDVVSHQFKTPCFEEVITADGTAEATTKNAALGILKDQTLDKIQAPSALDAVAIINNDAHFDETLSGKLDTNKEVCVLYWVVTAFKNNADIKDDAKVALVANAIINKYNFVATVTTKPTFAVTLTAMIKSNDPNAPEIFLNFLETNSEFVGFSDVDYKVIKNEIYKMSPLPTVTYNDNDTFAQALATQETYLATAEDANNLVRILSFLNKDDDALIGKAVDALSEKYQATSSFVRSEVIKAVKALASKDADAEKNFIELFKKSFVDINSGITSENVTSSITPAPSAADADANKNKKDENKNEKKDENKDDKKDEISADVKSAMGTVLGATTIADLKKSVTALEALLTKDVSIDKFKVAMKEELSKAIKASAGTFWTTDKDTALSKVIDVSFGVPVKVKDGSDVQTTLTTTENDIATAVLAAASCDVPEEVKTKITLIDRTTGNAKELVLLGVARLLVEDASETIDHLVKAPAQDDYIGGPSFRRPATKKAQSTTSTTRPATKKDAAKK